MRWVRHAPVLSLQWIDSKPVTILTTLFSANEEIDCQRRMKQDGNFQNVTVPQPQAIHYNQYMNGVDRSDQMLACHNVLPAEGKNILCSSSVSEVSASDIQAELL